MPHRGALIMPGIKKNKRTKKNGKIKIKKPFIVVGFTALKSGLGSSTFCLGGNLIPRSIKIDSIAVKASSVHSSRSVCLKNF